MPLKSLNETKWQAFFEANTFLPSLAFSIPTVFVQERLYVHGKRVDGRGGKFSDFPDARARHRQCSVNRDKGP